jgi:hypothetical protein
VWRVALFGGECGGTREQQPETRLQARVGGLAIQVRDAGDDEGSAADEQRER